MICKIFIPKLVIVQITILFSTFSFKPAESTNVLNFRGIDYPVKRFQVWEGLNPEIQSTAMSIGYSSTQWDNPGTFSLEKDKFNELDSNVQNALEQLSIDEQVWDCYLNHYRGYAWDDIESEGLAFYYTSLGLNETRWDEETEFVPEVNGRAWNELSTIEQIAARQLCYFEELWNGVEISSWGTKLTLSPSILVTNSPTTFPSVFPVNDLTSTPTISPTLSPTNWARTTTSPTNFPTYAPTQLLSILPIQIDPVDSIRYVPWDKLTDEFQALASSLGYEMESWNVPGMARLESRKFDSLENEDRQAVIEMGLSKEQWDCYINHYKGFVWDDFDEEFIVHLETLGWDRNLWESGNEFPSTRNKAWIDLNPSERKAAMTLCYKYETWERINLEEWVTSLSPSFAPNDVATSIPSQQIEEPESLAPVIAISLRPSESQFSSPSLTPTVMISRESSSIPTSVFSLDDIPLSTMTLFWNEAAASLDNRSFARSMIDYLTAFLVISARLPVRSINASAVIIDDRSAIVTGTATFEDRSPLISQADLENLLIVHFTSTGTETLYNFLLESGFDIQGPMRVEVGGFDTSRPSPIPSNEDETPFPWLILLVIVISLIGLTVAVVLVFTHRRKSNNPGRQGRPVLDLFRATTESAPSQQSSPSGMEGINMDDYSVDHSLYTTDDSYFQTVTLKD